MKHCPGCGSHSAHIVYEQLERFTRCETFEGKQLKKGGFKEIYQTAKNGRCSECGHGCRRVSQYDENIETPNPIAMGFRVFGSRVEL